MVASGRRLVRTRGTLCIASTLAGLHPVGPSNGRQRQSVPGEPEDAFHPESILNNDMPSETPPPAKPWPLQTWLGISAAAKPKVYEQIFANSDFKSLSYWLGIIFSAGIATFGLIENSPAVIIGAMLISPLMGPIMATGLALAAGDLYLGIRALINLLASVALSIAFSGFLVWLVPFHSATSEIISRTTPNLLDLAIALFSGLAGSVVVCRGGEDGVTAIPGVAIAVALMPPLGVMGFGLGSGVNKEIIGGAGLLFLTNLVAIVASAFLVFLLVGMGAPEAQRAVTASRGGEHPPGKPSNRVFARIVAAGAKLHWRAAMILILTRFHSDSVAPGAAPGRE